MPEPRQSSPLAAPRALLLAAAALVLACPPLAAQTFDRFFTTASERLLLDKARAEFHDPTPLPEPVASDEEQEKSGPAVPQITVSGVVIRARGQDTSWINGSGIRPDELTPEGIRVQPDRGSQPGVQIVLPESSAPIRLRPGQKIDLATGEVLEAYQRDATGDARNVFDGLDSTPSGSTSKGGTDSEPESPAASGG